MYWYVIIDRRKEGPYTLSTLKSHPHITPQTLGRKWWWWRWYPLGTIEELAPLFTVTLQPQYQSPPLEECLCVPTDRSYRFYLLMLLILLLLLLRYWRG